MRLITLHTLLTLTSALAVQPRQTETDVDAIIVPDNGLATQLAFGPIKSNQFLHPRQDIETDISDSETSASESDTNVEEETAEITDTTELFSSIQLPKRLVAANSTSKVCKLSIGAPLCCSLNVLGIANFKCANAGEVSSKAELREKCAKKDKSASCCLLSAAGSGILCIGV